jgi:type I restriction enzyme S subunit
VTPPPEIALEDVASSLGGLWGKAEPADGHTGVLVLRGTDFAEARRLELSNVPRRFEKTSVVSSRLLDPTCILIEASGGSKDQPVGRTFLVTDDLIEQAGLPVSAASFCKILRVDTATADPRYVYAVLQVAYRNGELERFQSQSTGLRNMRTRDLMRQFRFPLPSLDVQARIGAFVGSSIDLAATNERRAQTINELVQTLYREWFVERRHPGGEPRSTRASRWKEMSLGAVAQVNRANVKKNELPDPFEYLDISSLGVGRMRPLKLLPATEAPGRARRLVADGDVVWATVRPNRRSHCLVHDPNSNLVASTGLSVLSPVEVPSSFLYAYASSAPFTAHLVGRATGSAYPAVRPGDVESAPLLLPPVELLDRFDRIAEPMLRLAGVLRHHAAVVDETREMILPRLLRRGNEAG